MVKFTPSSDRANPPLWRAHCDHSQRHNCQLAVRPRATIHPVCYKTPLACTPLRFTFSNSQHSPCIRQQSWRALRPVRHGRGQRWQAATRACPRPLRAPLSPLLASPARSARTFCKSWTSASSQSARSVTAGVEVRACVSGVLAHARILLLPCFTTTPRSPPPQVKMLASSRSAGKKQSWRGEEHTIEELTPDSFGGVDIAFFSAGGSQSLAFAPAAAAAGATRRGPHFTRTGCAAAVSRPRVVVRRLIRFWCP